MQKIKFEAWKKTLHTLLYFENEAYESEYIEIMLMNAWRHDSTGTV